MNTVAFAEGVAAVCPVYAGDGPNDAAAVRVRRIYRRLTRGAADVTAGRAYRPGEWDALRDEGVRWANDCVARLAG